MKITRFHSFALSIALAVGAAVCPALIHAQDMVNGSFEDPAEAPNSITDITGTGVPGWTGNALPNIRQYIINGNVENSYGALYGTTPYGNQYLGLNGLANHIASIESQTVNNIVAGETYEFTVGFSNIGGATGLSLNIVVGDGPDGTGDVLGDESFQPLTVGPYGDGQIDFTLATLDFTAISTGSVTISLANQSRGTVAIDNASLRVLGVPEPSTWVLLTLGGAAGVGLTMRRQWRRLRGA